MNYIQSKQYNSMIANFKIQAEGKQVTHKISYNGTDLKVVAAIGHEKFYLFKIGPKGGMTYLTENNTWRSFQRINQMLVR